jgi:transcriptional regulator with XRE-family HTH domain
MDNKKIGLFLQSLRKQKNLTQLELATQLNVTHQSVSKWENGDSIPDISILSSLATFYQITIDELINGELKSPVVKVNEENGSLQNDKIWVISRLSCSLMIFISLFLYYINETINLGDYNPFNDWNPFNDMETVVNIRGFSLIFNASRLNLFSAGGWIIFLSLLVLLTVFSLEVISVFINHGKYKFIKEEFYLKTKKITEILVLGGFVMILLGVIFNSSVKFNIGYFIGLLFTIGLFVINYLENKKVL